jgi:tetratricopeptide (TPR) repeat protein
MGEFEQASSLAEEGLLFARASNTPWYEAYAIYNLGYIASLMGRYAQGYEQMLAGLDIWRKIGDPHYIALGLNFFVPTLNKLGRYEEAKAFMHESIALCETSKNRWGLGTAYSYLGLVCIADGQYEAAKAHLLKSLEIFSDYISGWNIARSLTYLGDAARMAGDEAEAKKYYLEGLHTSIESKAIPIALDALAGFSHLFAQSGKAEHALQLCAYILDHPASEEDTKSRASLLCAALEKGMRPEQIEAARLGAREKTLDSIVKLAQE